MCVCVWFKLNAPFNQFCWHALPVLPALLGDSLLNSFQYRQRNECVIIPSRHDPILPLLPFHSPHLLPCYSPCPTQSSLSHLPYLFIYLLSCLFIVLPLIAFVVSWPRDMASIFDFTFRISHSLSVLWPKTETDFIRYVTQHFIMHYSCYYILQGIQRRVKLCLLSEAALLLPLGCRNPPDCCIDLWFYA